MNGDLTILLAFAAGVISFLSPCVLPLVPAYLGQLTAVAVAASGPGATPGRWTAVGHALLFVGGFGLVFTALGVAAAFAGGAIADYMRQLRIIGGAILVLMGLSLAGILRIPFLERTWRPLDAGASAGLTAATGGMSLAPADAGMGGRMGTRLVGGRVGLWTSFALGAIFAVGWTPCIGIMLGAILTMAAGQGASGEAGRLGGALLLFAYTLGLGLPFILIAAFYDRSRRFLRFLVKHGRAVSLVGGLLVAAVGIAMMFDWLVLLPRYFSFFAAI